MRFLRADVAGAFIIEQDRHEDERGFFARTWSVDELAALGLEAHLEQCSVSHNRRRGTLRGLHFQLPPVAEVKVVRCTRGALFDVCADLRPDSPTFRRWFGAELTGDNGRAMYVPRGCAHGFLTLEDETDIEYQISAPHVEGRARGVRWNDPLLNVAWPAPVIVISDRDRTYADLDVAGLAELTGL